MTSILEQQQQIIHGHLVSIYIKARKQVRVTAYTDSDKAMQQPLSCICSKVPKKSQSRYQGTLQATTKLHSLLEELARTMGGSQSTNGSQLSSSEDEKRIVQILGEITGKATSIPHDDHEAQLTSKCLQCMIILRNSIQLKSQ